VIADSHVIQAAGGAGFWVASTGSAGSVITKHLGDHIIADDVEISDETDGWRGIALLGAGTGAWLSAQPRAGLVFPGRRRLGENWEWLHSASESAGALESVLGARMAASPEMERVRILAGIPSVPGDIGPSDLPNEGGLEASAISYSKGCYLGQEVMARIKSMGRVRRTLVRVSGPGEPPPIPCGLWRGERREGELRSAAPAGGGFVGLALVSVAGAGGPFGLGPGAHPALAIAVA
jgi:hypothetical protein